MIRLGGREVGGVGESKSGLFSEGFCDFPRLEIRANAHKYYEVAFNIENREDAPDSDPHEGEGRIK